VVPGLVLATLGTSGVMYAHSEHPRPDLSKDGKTPPGRTQNMCAADGSVNQAGHWCVTGCMLSAAGSLQWARDTIAPGVAFDVLLGEAAVAPVGCDGLVFLPYLNGERCPHPDPLARGGWIGLRAQHTRGHLVRAVLEGVTFGMGQMLDLVRALPVHVDRIRLGGGGSKSDLWQQMQADVYGLPCSMLSSDEGPAFGVALLAGVGIGVWPSVKAACAATILEVKTCEPAAAETEAADRYRRARAVYERLYGDLVPAMHALTASQTT
jgi:xylulokinase